MTIEKVILIYTIITGVWNLINIFQLDSKLSRQTGEVLSTLEYVLPSINHAVRAATIIYLTPKIKPLIPDESYYVVISILISIILGTIIEMFLRTFVLSSEESNE